MKFKKSFVLALRAQVQAQRDVFGDDPVVAFSYWRDGDHFRGLTMMAEMVVKSQPKRQPGRKKKVVDITVPMFVDASIAISGASRRGFPPSCQWRGALSEMPC